MKSAEFKGGASTQTTAGPMSGSGGSEQDVRSQGGARETSTGGESTQEVATNRPVALLEAQWSELPIPDFEPAVLWYRANAPLWVITHGAGGNAEWHCQHFHQMLQGRASLLCPRGKRRYTAEPSQGYYYPDHLALRREVLLAVERFEALAPKARPYVYAGYSQGATMGALAIAASGDLFSDLLLVEGGFADWSSALVNQFKKSGGRAVLFVCGTQHCRDLARGAANRLKLVGVDTRVTWANGAGHRPDGTVEQHTLEALPFLLERDERWAGFRP